MKIDQIKLLIDKFEEAVGWHSNEIDGGWDRKEEQKAEKARTETKKALIEAIQKAIK